MPSLLRLRGTAGTASLLAFVGLLYVLPIIMIVYGAFRTAAPGLPGEWSMDGFLEAFSDARTYSTLGNSLWLAMATGIGATSLAVVFAWIVSRTNAGLRRMVTPLMVVVLAMPPLFFSLSWNLLGTPKFGLINQLLGAIGLPDTLLSVGGRWGTWFVLCLKICGLGYFILIGPFLAMDRRLEEASLVAGGSRLATFVRINVPMMAPAVLGAFIINFIIGLIAFDVPLIIGKPSGFQVLATQIYAFVTNDTPPDYAAASALAMVFILAVVVLVAIKWRLLDRRQFTTLSGKGARPEPWDIGRWRWLCNSFVLAYAVLAVALPTVQIVLGSLQPLFGVQRGYSLDNYRALLADPTVAPALWNTAQLAFFGGLLAVAISLLLGIVGRHASVGLRRTLELATWLPWAAHGIILGLALVWAFLTVPFLKPLFGTVWIVLLGLVIASTPLASRTTDAALAQVGRELEESARVSGASALRTAVGIVTRLILPACVAAWVITAIQIAGNLEVPVLLSLPTNETVAVMVYQLNTRGETVQAAALFCLVLGAAALGALLLAVGSGLRRLLRRRRLAPPPPIVAESLPAAARRPAPGFVAAARANSKSRTDLLLGDE
ncbi:ABC transporter permease [Dactylosporangium sucinum]|uniref:ABC transporter substrate-binding protein n=1 Tax=Dactylosporangium sucinum TaxID=1424081 RepID=A0A917U9F5_9ACTN|nr:iron ABC transporter permease [Dactylosporangium sucinum]GGM67346.1 ABC transporter substrate-binding protein [Dactylosporangium sucinum]